MARQSVRLLLFFLISFLLLFSCGDGDPSTSSGQATGEDDPGSSPGLAPDDDDAADDDSADDDNDDNDDSDDDDNNDDNDDNDALPNVPIKDDLGRTLILHGCNYMGMEFGWFNHAPEDFLLIASWGFNIVRLPIAWNYLEPEEGVYDEDYLADVVEPVVGYAADAGLKVIIDMHQWQWSPCSAGNGAPGWTCDTPTGGTFDWFRQGHLFWNHPEYLEHFVGAWGLVAEHFSGDDRVWGYDLWNEPVAGLHSLPWTFDNQLLRPLYIRFIDAIRAHHPEPYVIIEPNITHASLLLPFVMDPLPYERQIYAPHLYPGGMGSGGEYSFGIELLRVHVQRLVDEANDRGLPMLIGETGVVSSAASAEFYTRTASQVFDEKLAHFTWWTFWKDDSSYGLLDASGNEKALYFPYLVRPYPQATAGRLRAFGYDPDTKDFSLGFETDETLDLEPHVEIFVPAQRHYPDGFEVTCSDDPGTWSFEFDEASSILTVNCDPGALEHTVWISAAAVD